MMSVSFFIQILQGEFIVLPSAYQDDEQHAQYKGSVDAFV
jgi:hypothetical protein